MTEENNGSLVNPPVPFDWSGWLAKFRHPGPTQIGVLAGVVALLALLVVAALWLNTATYDVLYRGLAEADAGQMMDALQKANIPVKIDPRSGALMVPADQVYQARLKLATQGLPRSTVNGLESLQQNSFGLSQFMETARYQHALEGELARSIMTIGAIEKARIHLAFPKETVFARQQQPPTASVLVQLRAGRSLDEGQVAAIIHLVASSVPKLRPEQVSVIDQAGNLLTRQEREGGGDKLNLDQLEYTRRLEDRYARRVEELLAPVMGMGRVRAQVALDLDFTASEETAERYEPRQEPRPLRSEQLLEETKDRMNPVGVPGALSNQPPGAATAPEVATAQNPAANPQNPAAPAAPPLTSRKEVTRNYELDKRVSHTRNTPGRIVRVSTAVVVDDRATVEAGQSVRKPLTTEEVERITALVKQAVGFSADRGDSVNVMNAAFAPSPFEEAPLPMWQQPWFLELVKWGVVAVLSLAILLLVVRPLLRRLLPVPVAAVAKNGNGKNGNGTSHANGHEVAALPAPDAHGLEGLLEDRVELSGALENDGTKALPSPTEQLDQRMDLARSLVAEDPKRAVHVIKSWLTSEA
ncbi:flagellar basal-body MS-ring/collar protein FliF [Candidatus Contendibacter odensensis]|uniref:Flagellar M-ring protein n=1 Tax=Candidatus Contendobacter odensis Run_B_J11 TaxID=1400861 RepID=A0A7U7G9R5_9GAMM|nr:flagellar basal-body MS-ring/collar protein FliF [Candidatus Contendobacter odensis]CDH44165.1 Flagellar M-ring protein [Candidatus Contendobacter odensis Run_B_J11]